MFFISTLVYVFLPVTFRQLSTIFFRRLPLDGEMVVIPRRHITLIGASRGRAPGGLSGDHRRYVRVDIGPHLDSQKEDDEKA